MRPLPVIGLGMMLSLTGVIAIDRDGNGCSQIAEEVQKQGGAALALECDVSEAESVSVAASRALAA